MKPLPTRPCWRWQSVLLLTLLAHFGIALAHPDPRGDIHARVSVVAGAFEVRYQVHPVDEPDDSDRPLDVLGDRYAANGERLVERGEVEGEEGATRLAGEIYEGRVGEVRYRTTVDRDGAVVSEVVSPPGSRTQRLLPFPPGLELIYLADALVTGQGIALAAVVSRREEGRFGILWHPHGVEQGPTFVELAVPSMIYDYPVASNLVWTEGRFWIATMRAPTPVAPSQPILWSWKPGDNEARQRLVEGEGAADTTMSMAAIGGRLCLAFHRSDEESSLAQVAVHFEKTEP